MDANGREFCARIDPDPNPNTKFDPDPNIKFDPDFDGDRLVARPLQMDSR